MAGTDAVVAAGGNGQSMYALSHCMTQQAGVQIATGMQCGPGIAGDQVWHCLFTEGIAVLVAGLYLPLLAELLTVFDQLGIVFDAAQAVAGPSQPAAQMTLAGTPVEPATTLPVWRQ